MNRNETIKYVHKVQSETLETKQSRLLGVKGAMQSNVHVAEAL